MTKETFQLLKNFKALYLICTIALLILNLPGIAQTAYITNSWDSTINVINLETNTVTNTISVPSYPFGVSVSPDGSKVYITHCDSITMESSLSVINTSTNTLSTTIPLISNYALGLAVNPNGSKIYVADSLISVINTSTNTISSFINTNNGIGTANPYGVCISKDGSKLFVANYGNNTATIINTATETILATINVGNNPMAICVNSDGSKVYVTNFSDSTVSVIDANSYSVLTTINVGANPNAICISPDDSKIYVSNMNGPSVSVINSATNTVVSTITTILRAQGISLSSDASKLYVMDSYSNSVSVINTSNYNISMNISVGEWPTSFGNFISIYPTICLAYYTTDYDSILNTFTLNVDSLSSSLAVGFQWDFGDGTTSTLNSPTHFYTIDSLFKVCMKVYVSSGDSCEYCHIIGKDSLGNVIQRASGFSLITRNNSTIKVVDQNNENAIIIAPNPFKSATTVTFNEIQINTTIKIFDILGKEIKRVNFSGKEYNIEKGIMKEGLYILQIENENKDIKKMKIVLQ
jgi:YVTN family beta-propeller protein